MAIKTGNAVGSVEHPETGITEEIAGSPPNGVDPERLDRLLSQRRFK
jgi:hypothetical protein